MGPVLFDTSFYIAALRAGDAAVVQLRRFSPAAPVWLSSIVLEELYAGAKPREARVIERLERDFERAQRILVPNLRDWAQSGKLLSRLALKYGYERIGQSRLCNDALLAMSAARNGMTIITVNERDFARLAEFRPFRWQVSVP